MGCACFQKWKNNHAKSPLFSRQKSQTLSWKFLKRHRWFLERPWTLWNSTQAPILESFENQGLRFKNWVSRDCHLLTVTVVTSACSCTIMYISVLLVFVKHFCEYFVFVQDSSESFWKLKNTRYFCWMLVKWY